MRSDPWKFQSNWRAERWIDQPDVDDFIASTNYLYVSDTVLGGTGTYFKLNTGTGNIEFYENSSKIAEWTSLPTSAPVTIEDGVPMGLLLALTYEV